MSLLGRLFGLLVGLAFIAALGAAAYLALEFIVSLFASLDAQVARVTAIASAVALLAAMLLASAIREATQKSKANQIREQKGAAYQLFIDCWEDQANAPGKLQSLDRQLALYGGGAVIKSHVALRAIAREKGPRHPEAAAQFGKALLEIRKDLGADVKAGGVTALELQQLVLTTPASSLSHAGTGERSA
jgi:type II secretory pathway component PulJ